MKKLYLLLAASVLICGTTMAQLAKHDLMNGKANFSASKINTNKQKPNTQRDETVVWSCDFENENAYTIVDGAGTVSTWHATSETNYPSSLAYGSGYLMWPMNFSGNSSQQAYQMSETPSTWMIMNLIGEHYCNGADCWGDGIWGPIESSIVFTDIDLSSCPAPKFTLNQSYRAFNPTWNQMFVETSIDGGANWTEHEFNIGTWQNGTYIDDPIEVLLPEVGGRNGVTIRIRYINNPSPQDPTSYAAQYGWQIDDAKIVSAPSHNLTINDGRISMFSYYDYRQDLTNVLTNSNMTESEKRDYLYQIYDPYAQTPVDQWNSTQGFAAFNVEYTNMGATSATPKVNIVVTSPSGAELYNKTLTGAAIASTVRDTIDFGTIDDDNMANSTIFYFEDDIELGRYTVTFTVSEDGVEDSNPADNTLTQYFDITANSYSKSYYEPTSYFNMNGYTSSQSGDMYGTTFLYFYSPDDIMSTDLYIAEGTTVGASIQIQLFHQNDDGDYVQDRASDWVEITEDMIGTWTNFLFLNEYPFQFSTDETYREVTVMACGQWDNSADRINLGISEGLSTRKHSNMEYITTYDKWYYGSDDIALNFHTGEGAVVNAAQNVAEGIDMYPNPSNGIVNFTNVENATIEVYNMMGQIVASESNVSENASIDLSGVANGNYIVRIVKDGAIATSKLNIVK
jgi:hypothetical protein